MHRRIFVFLCLLLPVTASAQTTMEWIALGVVDWGKVASRGEIMASGLPSIQSAREAARRSARRYQPIRIRKRIDRASPVLKRAFATKKPLPRVVLKGRDRSGTYLIWELKQVRITSYSVSESAANEPPTEEISFVFNNFRMIPPAVRR